MSHESANIINWVFYHPDRPDHFSTVFTPDFCRVQEEDLEKRVGDWIQPTFAHRIRNRYKFDLDEDSIQIAQPKRAVEVLFVDHKWAQNLNLLVDPRESFQFIPLRHGIRQLLTILRVDQNPDHLHLVVTAEAENKDKTAVKRKRDDPINVSRKLFGLWATPVKQNLVHLKEYLERPLDPDWKVPLSHVEWKNLLVSGVHDHACHDQDLELLFKQCEDETAPEARHQLETAILYGPRGSGGTEDSLHCFWDDNIRNILIQCLNAKSIRNSNQGTETGVFRPDFGLLLADSCVFRGEEKPESGGKNGPKDELKDKTRWVYDPAPYILAYYAIGVSVTLAAILPPKDGEIRVMDLIKADLSSRAERIKNASRMIKMCGILQWLQQVIGEGKDEDMLVQTREGGKSITYFTSHVRKTYGLGGDVDCRGDEADGKKRIEHLQAIYAALASKRVPNVDRLKKAEILHRVRGSFVDLEPVGFSAGPKSLLDVRNAVVCILEALKVAHAYPPVFHRDIRWPNIMQSREDTSKWFLIDWEDSSFAPTKAAPHLSHTEHSPKVCEDNHGADVDIWAVGRLLCTARRRTPALVDLGQRMKDGHVLSAEQGLKEICDLPEELFHEH